MTGKAGDPAAARDLSAGLLPVRERVLGAGHPDTLAARANLAYRTSRAHGHAGSGGLRSFRERVGKIAS
jgi:hypothetical protein